jgi:DNA-binding transcriptional LysR family regulator
MLHAVKLSSFDLNHVRALHFLLEEAHVARAARRLSITPAAASNALKRLRDELGDQLLVQVGRTFARTPLAEELRPHARDVIHAAARLVDAAVPFDPLTYEGTLVLSAADRIAEVLVHPIDVLLSTQAPSARLQIRTLSGPFQAIQPEQRGLFILPAGLHKLSSEALFTEPYVCVFRAGHPLSRGKLSIQRYAAAEHILVAPRGESQRGVVDEALMKHGLTRRVTRVVTSSTLAIALLQTSDRIATLPASFASARAKGGDLAQRTPPLTLEPNHMEIAWHPQQDGDPRYTWFRKRIHDAVRSLGLKTNERRLGRAERP